MAWSFKKRTVEYIIYLLFWSVLLLSPLFGAFIKSAFYKDDTFMPTVDELVAFWGFLLPAHWSRVMRPRTTVSMSSPTTGCCVCLSAQ